MSQCGWYAVPLKPHDRRRYKTPWARGEQVMAVAFWPCPLCHASAGVECYGESPHKERADSARRQWWGPTLHEEIMARHVS